jgi:hypothetical protein
MVDDVLKSLAIAILNGRASTEDQIFTRKTAAREELGLPLHEVVGFKGYIHTLNSRHDTTLPLLGI